MRTQKWYISICLALVLPVISMAQGAENFGKSQTQIINQFSNNPEYTFTKKQYVDHGTVAMLQYYVHSDNIECIALYYFSPEDKLEKYVEVFPKNKLHDMYLFYNNAEIYKKLDDDTFLNTSTNVLVEIDQIENTCSVSYRLIKPKSKKSLSTHKIKRRTKN